MVLQSKLLCALLFSIFFSLNLFAGEDVSFKIEKIKIGSKTISVELAESETQLERGLMNRHKLESNAGMLFVFKDEQIRSFWMKNTIIDLSIGYFNKNKKLIDIQDMSATSIMQKELPNYPSRAPAMYALEMNKGWFRKNKISLGVVFSFLIARP